MPPKLKEMRKLAEMLRSAQIPHDMFMSRNVLQLLYPRKDNWICSVICFPCSCGYEEGLLEIMGLTHSGQSVEGYLTAEDVFERIAEDYKQRHHQ